MLSRFVTSSLYAFGLVLVAACGPGGEHSGNTAASAASAAVGGNGGPTYLAAVDASYAPFEFRDDNGLVMGYDIDIINAIGADQGFKVQFISQPWEGIFDTLDDSSRHMVVAPLNITPERQQRMEMTDPYISIPLMVLYTDPSLNIRRFEDLKHKHVATQTDTYAVERLNALNGNGDYVTSSPTLYLAIKELAQGRVQAVVGDAPVLRYSARHVPLHFHTWVERPDDGSDLMAFAVKKGDTELLAKINTGLANIKANGTYATINEKWFGETAPVATAASAAQ